MGSSTAIVYALLKLNHIRQCQPWISTENLFHELEIAYISATICLWSVVAVSYTHLDVYKRQDCSVAKVEKLLARGKKQLAKQLEEV